MARLVWNEPKDRHFETGIDRGVLYVDGEPAVPWTGLKSVVERPSGGDPRPYYIDGVKYLNLATLEEFAGTIEALYSPPEFDICDGAAVVAQGVRAHQQLRRAFGLSFRSRLGNGVEGPDFGYKIHIIYNALASPTTRSYLSNGNTDNPLTLSWDISSRNIAFPETFPAAHVVIDTAKASIWGVAQIEEILYGSEEESPRLPEPEEILSIFGLESWIYVIDNLDGTFTIHATDDLMEMVDPFTFQIDSPQAIDHGDGSFTISTTPKES